MTELKIVLSDEAIRWFTTEMDISSGDAIQFFARYGGSSPLHEGFTLGVRKEKPDEIAVQEIRNGVTYYIERRDEWFFQDHDLHVEVDPTLDELSYAYKKA